MRQENPSVIRDYDKPKNHHGFVYVRAGRDGRVPLWEMRKPTPDERLAIIENYIRMHGSEGPIKVSFFSEKLGVSDRTVQSILRLLEEKKAITIEPVFNENEKQQGNIYHWTGNVDPVIGGPTMEMLYKRYDSYGFRSFNLGRLQDEDGSVWQSHMRGLLPIWRAHGREEKTQTEERKNL